jgi:hypothetical protein
LRDFDRSLHNKWDRQLEEGLPDCRLSGPRRRATTLVHRGKLKECVFCANCGKSGGVVDADLLAHVFYYCDDCYHKFGCKPPPGMEMATRSEEKRIKGQ